MSPQKDPIARLFEWFCDWLTHPNLQTYDWDPLARKVFIAAIAAIALALFLWVASDRPNGTPTTHSVIYYGP